MEEIKGHYLADAKEHFPSYNFIEVVKDGVPQEEAAYAAPGEEDVLISTQDGIIIEVYND